MNHFFTLLFATSCLTAVGQTDYVLDSVLIDEGWSLVLERDGRQYWLFDEDREWEEARAMCEALEANLYWPNSIEEHLDVWESVVSGDDNIQYWTAIHQDFTVVDCANANGGWAGPNGEPQTFFYWSGNEPTNGGNGRESVVQFEWSGDGAMWNDAPGQACDEGNGCDCRLSRVILERSGFPGCTNPMACNFNIDALEDDGSCLDCSLFAERCGPGTIWDAQVQMCIGDGSGDINFDGCVQLNDLLDLLGAYGNCGAEETLWQCGDPLEYQGYYYETVQIGEQCWFAENLKVVTFDNGEAIPFMGEIGAGVSAMAYPDGSEALYEQYGGLYNWFATDDERGLCPNNWRVSTDEDWVILENQLSGLNLDGGALKSSGSSSAATSSWNEPNEGATNVLGFNAEAAGQRNFDLAFERFGERGWYWAYSNYPKMARELRHDSSSLWTLSTDQRDCLSVRCIKATE